MDRKLIFLPSDIIIIIMNLIFSLFSFLNIGNQFINLGGFKVDKEILSGCLFLLFIPMQFLIIKFTNPRKSKGFQLLRLMYPQFFYGIFFTETIILSQLISNNNSFDTFFAYFDYLMFHYQPSSEFYKVFEGNRIVNELFFFSYFFYYIIITSCVWILFFKKKFKEASFVVFAVTTSFCVLYIWYLFFPVKGPKFFFPSLNNIWYNHFQGYYFTDLMKKVFSTTNLGGAAFPSSHVAISLLVLFLSRQYNKIFVPIYLPFIILLMFSTVYLYAHYFIDVIGGVVAAIILYSYIPLLYKPIELLIEKIEKYAIIKQLFRSNNLSKYYLEKDGKSF